MLILVVDDDPLSLDLIALLLEAEGHRVVLAGTGVEALHVMQSRIASGDESTIPNAVLTDMQMPDMPGHELCRQLRQVPGNRAKLIGMSATRPPGNSLEDTDAFVLKPLDAHALQGILTGEAADAAGRSEAVPALRSSALDADVVEKLRKLMPPGSLDELFAVYLSDTRVRLTEMEASALAGDDAAVRRSAHMMKGSAAMTGASGISRAAALLEKGSISLDKQRTLFDEMRCACDAIEGTLARDARTHEAHDHQTF